MTDDLREGDLEVSRVGEVQHTSLRPIKDLPDAWQVIGFCGSCERSEIPKVLTAAVLDPTGAFVATVDVAETIEDLLDAPRFTRASFSSSVALGDVTRLPAFFWEPGAVLFFQDGALDYVSVLEAEVRLNQFVRAHRAAGQAALDRQDREAALQEFDLARCVSNEREDIEQVVALEQDDKVKAIFAQALQQ